MTEFPAQPVTPPTRRRPRARRGIGAVVAFTVLLALLSALTAPAAEAAVPKMTITEWRMAVATRNLLNVERHAHHLPALRFADGLLRSARNHNLAMARANTMSHQLPGEPYLGTRITRAGYRWHYAGENIGWNSSMTTAGVLQLEKIMYAERPPNDGHRRNILSGHYTQLGVDVSLDWKHHKVWLTVDFGHP